MVREDLENAGYDREEEYFRRMERELIERRRRELDAKRAEQGQSEPERHPHWMRCPKCGSQLAEQKMEGIVVDRCESCGGIFFDRGELELLLGSQEPKGVMSSLRKLFG
jgi:hypothetical protein